MRLSVDQRRPGTVVVQVSFPSETESEVPRSISREIVGIKEGECRCGQNMGERLQWLDRHVNEAVSTG